MGISRIVLFSIITEVPVEGLGTIWSARACRSRRIAWCGVEAEAFGGVGYRNKSVS